MKLHENKALFEEAVELASIHKGLRGIYIEKDYWVTLALHTIFTNEIGTQTVFKGGTALSKCFNIIERFSEDIDLVVLRNVGESDNQMTNKIKKIGKCIESVLPEIAVEGITQKRGMNRKTAHSYEKMYEANFGQVRDVIILEATWFGHYEPYTTTFIQSYIAEMMTANNQTALMHDYNLQPFAVQVLTKERTLCKKIMSLVRFSFTENPIFDLNNKVRHIYDIHKLLQDTSTHQFFNSVEFDTLLLKVAHDDVKSFKNNNAWLSNHPLKALIFSDTLNTWNQIKQTYNSDFKALVFGELPNEKDMLNTLNYVSNRLEAIKWTIV